MALSSGFLLSAVLTRGPVMIAAVAGIIVALTMWQRGSKAALLVIGACVLLLIDQLISIPIGLGPVLATGYGLSTRSIVIMSTVLGLLSSLLLTASVALFIAAAFAGRPAPAGATVQQPPPHHPYGAPQPPPRNPYQR